MFLGIISELHTKFFGISDCFFPRQAEIPHPPPPVWGGVENFFHHPPPQPLQSGGIFDISEEELPHSLKKKHCQRLAWLVKCFLPKLVSLAKSLSASARFACQIFFSLSSLAKSLCVTVAVFAHMCVRCAG